MVSAPQHSGVDARTRSYYRWQAVAQGRQLVTWCPSGRWFKCVFQTHVFPSTLYTLRLIPVLSSIRQKSQILTYLTSEVQINGRVARPMKGHFVSLIRQIHLLAKIIHENQASFFGEIVRLILKFVWNYKKPRISKTISKKKKGQSWGTYFFILRLTTKLPGLNSVVLTY